MNNDMKQQEINLSEILKGHEGATFYSPLYGNVELTEIAEEGSIRIQHLNGLYSTILTRHGKYADEGELLLYPSRIQRDWNAWIEEHKRMTYADVCRELFRKRYFRYYNDPEAIIAADAYDSLPKLRFNAGNATSKKQLLKLMAINRLMNVQKWIEKGWQPDWSKGEKWFVSLLGESKEIQVRAQTYPCMSPVYFSSEANARKAIDILGEDVIRQALSTDW